MHADQHQVQAQAGLAEHGRRHRDAHLHRIAEAHRDGAHRRQRRPAPDRWRWRSRCTRIHGQQQRDGGHEVGQQRDPPATGRDRRVRWCGTAAPARRCRRPRCRGCAPGRPGRRPATQAPGQPAQRDRDDDRQQPAQTARTCATPPRRGGRAGRWNYRPKPGAQSHDRGVVVERESFHSAASSFFLPPLGGSPARAGTRAPLGRRRQVRAGDDTPDRHRLRRGRAPCPPLACQADHGIGRVWCWRRQAVLDEKRHDSCNACRRNSPARHRRSGARGWWRAPSTR